ncbi:protein kinase family protein [Thalassospira sp. NFXS8]|uniref:protein kinase family protein n=1 Tax=Thalassospira sp. NFXS8 TaxID=2819093 RepID=UPI0032E02179
MADNAKMQPDDAQSGLEFGLDGDISGDGQEDQIAPSPETAPPRGAGNKHIDIGNFRVFPDLRLPEFDCGPSQAYVAEGIKRDDGPIFALLTDPSLPTRSELLRVLSGVRVSGQLDLLDYEIVYWPPLDRSTIVCFYTKPGGSKVFVDGGKKAVIDEHDLPAAVIVPVINILTILSDKNLAHRNLRADNLFFADEQRSSVVVGDCVSCPPGFAQPLVYEPIDRMTAEAAGRGGGALSDDLYALGITIAALGIGHTPLSKFSDKEIIEMKLARGSFQTLAAHEKLPLTLIEPIRGLLCDDFEERWGLSELNNWLDGRRVKPVQGNSDRRAARAQNVGGRDYYTARGLANGIANNWAASLAPLRDGVVEVWLRRGLNDAERSKAMSEAMRQMAWSGSDKRTAEDVLVSRGIAILDPNGPVRHKTFSAMLDGLGYMLSYDVQHGRGAQAFSEIVVRDLPTFWFSRISGFRPEIQSQQQVYKGLRYYMQQQSMGYGYERCLYALVKNQHCLSPLVENEYVIHIAQLLPALEKIASVTPHSNWPVDRHIAAFIAVRLQDDTEPQLTALQNPGDEVEFSRSIISLLALVQWRHGPDSLPHLGLWVARLMEPATKVFHNKERREKVEREIPRLAKRGNLVELYNLINDEKERRLDQDEFIAAVEEYSAADSEVFDLESSGAARLILAEQIGRQVASFASTMIALLTVSALFMMTVW